MKSNMRIFFPYNCSKHMYSASGNYMSDILFYKNETEIKKKKIFRPFRPGGSAMSVSVV